MQDILESYNYAFPKELIATHPASPRDSARLLIYNRGNKTITHDTVHNLDAYLPKNAVVVLNETKVVPARLTLKKETGGLVKILYLGVHKSYIEALAPKPLKPNEKLWLTDQLFFAAKSYKLSAKSYLLKPSFSLAHIYKVLEEYGETPLPPYIKSANLTAREKKALKEKYQTVFAKRVGSVAAPTASLHFTERLIKKLKEKGVKVYFITLHVGLGTFAPVTAHQLTAKKLHKEWFAIDKKTAHALNAAKQEGRPIIAVGTTTVRTLESASNKDGILENIKGTTDLFIEEGYRYKFVDGLMTNFHVPKSSLMMLVSSFIGREELLKAYKEAIAKKYRLFSFGDAMFVL